MKCPKCGGTGFVPTNVFGVNGAIKCDFCDGTGVFITNAVEPMTNDEWRRTCSAEEFANWIREDVCADSFWQRAYDWESWLKEKHDA